MSEFFNKLVSDTEHGYHLNDIPKGIYGDFSKIEEEFLEFADAHKQNNYIMALVELSDLIITIDAYANKYNMTLDDLISMAKATSRAHLNGYRNK